MLPACHISFASKQKAGHTPHLTLGCQKAHKFMFSGDLNFALVERNEIPLNRSLVPEMWTLGTPRPAALHVLTSYLAPVSPSHMWQPIPPMYGIGIRVSDLAG